jgi:hypothetical protein
MRVQDISSGICLAFGTTLDRNTAVGATVTQPPDLTSDRKNV